VLALAVCTAVTKQPADFGHRRWAGMLVLGLAALLCSATASIVGIAAPLTAGLALAALYNLAYDPVLPESLVNRLPMRIVLLEPTVPMVIAIAFIIWWVIFTLSRPRALDTGPSIAVRSLAISAQLLISIGIVLYLSLAHVYDLEGGATFWKLVLVSFLYLDLMWIGVESSARRMFGWPVAAVLFLGMLAGFVRNLYGGGPQ
jgi:hypothetical protein